MTDVDMVRAFASQFTLKNCHVTTVGAPTFFLQHKMFLAYGGNTEFDFVTLPSGTFGHFAMKGDDVTWIRRGTDSLQCLLRDEWDNLPKADLCKLVEFVVDFVVDNPIKDGHHVLQDAFALRMMDSNDRKIDEDELGRIVNEVGTTNIHSTANSHTIRFVSLCGWMHTKQELGWNELRINIDGHFSVSHRNVISKRIFTKLPNIRY